MVRSRPDYPSCLRILVYKYICNRIALPLRPVFIPTDPHGPISPRPINRCKSIFYSANNSIEEIRRKATDNNRRVKLQRGHTRGYAGIS